MNPGGKNASLHCCACENHDLISIGHLPLRTQGGVLEDTVFKCRRCGSYMRAADFSDPRVQTHFDVSQYTNPQFEAQFLKARGAFFTHLIELAEEYCGCPAVKARVLDVGASFGHLINQYRERGAACTAIEVSERASAVLEKNKIDTMTSAEELSADAVFDVITVIDSLYYFQDPGRTLRQLCPHLDPGGVMILRIANRTPILNLLRLLRRPITEKTFGDAKSNFSYRGICRLLDASGYCVVSVILRERGKRAWTRVRRLYYRLSLSASRLLGLKITPGIILVCKRSDGEIDALPPTTISS